MRSCTTPRTVVCTAEMELAPSSCGVGVAAGEGWTPTAYSERRDATVGSPIGRLLVDYQVECLRLAYCRFGCGREKSVPALFAQFPWRPRGCGCFNLFPVTNTAVADPQYKRFEKINCQFDSSPSRQADAIVASYRLEGRSPFYSSFDVRPVGRTT